MKLFNQKERLGFISNAISGNNAETRKKIRQRKKALFDNVPEIAWLKDRKGRFIAASALFARACGVAHEDLIGKTDWDIWPRKLAESNIIQDRAVIKSGRPASSAASSVGEDDSSRWTEIVRTPIFDNKGSAQGTLGIARDISVHKQAESRLRRMSRQLLRAREEEKKKISNLLHDEVGSIIMRLNSSLFLMEMDVRSGSRNSAIDRIKKTQQMVRELAAQIRKICANIRPPAMNISGLAGSARELVRRVAACTAVKIHCDIRLANEKIIDDLVKIIVYRIVQEALSNAVKHAKAENVKIAIILAGGKLKFSVTDDGKGFDMNKTGGKNGGPKLGLRIMREEAVSVPAVLSVDSMPGFGTVVKGEFPVRPVYDEATAGRPRPEAAAYAD